MSQYFSFCTFQPFDDGHFPRGLNLDVLAPHTPFHLFFFCSCITAAAREIFFLGHGNALPWNFPSGTVPRVKHLEPAYGQKACSRRPEPFYCRLSLAVIPSGRGVRALLTSFPRIPHVHAAQPGLCCSFPSLHRLTVR